MLVFSATQKQDAPNLNTSAAEQQILVALYFRFFLPGWGGRGF